MKKLCSFLIVLVLCTAFLLPFSSHAATVTGSLTGPSTVRAGDSITLTYKLKGTDIKAFSASLSYDSSKVTLSKVTKSIADPWSLTTNGNELMLADENLSAPIKKETKLFTVVFKVKSSLSVGTKISISLTNCVASTGSAQDVAKTTYSATIAAPKSTNAKLKSMSITGGTLSPAFSANTESYSVTVPFSVSKLEVKASAADSKAKVSVNSPNLSVGENTVTVTVTAESGAKKTYTIKVTREQDPNYVPADNADLSGIKIDGYVLSPVFAADVTEYVVWLPYETESITVSGTPADSKAKVEVRGGDALEPGKDNPVTILCTAENGTTTKEYTLIAKRAAAHGTQDPGSSDVPSDDPSNPGADDPGTNDPGTDTPGTDDPGQDQPPVPSVKDPLAEASFSLYWLVGIGAGALVFGLVLGLLMGRRSRRSKH